MPWGRILPLLVFPLLAGCATQHNSIAGEKRARGCADGFAPVFNRSDSIAYWDGDPSSMSDGGLKDATYCVWQMRTAHPDQWVKFADVSDREMAMRLIRAFPKEAQKRGWDSKTTVAEIRENDRKATMQQFAYIQALGASTPQYSPPQQSAEVRAIEALQQINSAVNYVPQPAYQVPIYQPPPTYYTHCGKDWISGGIACTTNGF